ncbi:MAG: restriction endonuclease subunit S [Zoogloea sp.]|nr:restriction endonuclease subunit S [Zoogloea sp.]
MSSEPVAVKEATTYPRGFAKSTDWKWPLVPARQLVALNYGRALKADTRRPGEIPVYGTNGQCGWHDTLLAQGPGLILGRKGQGPLGVEWCPTNFWVIDTAYYATTLTHSVDLKYLYHLIKHVGLNHLKDGTSNPTLSRDVFGAQLFPLPSLCEQRAITEALDTLDDRIALLRETNATLEAIAQALFKSWFVDFDPVRAKQQGLAPEGMDEETAALFPDGFEESVLGLVPKGWRVCGFTETINVIGGGTPKTSVSEYWSGPLPWFSVVDAPARSDVYVVDTEKHISELGLANSSTKLLRPGTTIISARGTVGKLALTGCPMTMNQSCYGLQGKADDSYFTYFTTCRLIEALQQRAHGSVFDTITRDTLAGVSVTYPDPAIIKDFERIVLPVMERIKENLEQARTLATLHDTLLPRLISGQLRLPDAEAQLEEATA